MCKFGKCWRGITSVAAVLLLCFSILNIIVALVYKSDCPDKGYRIPLFLLALGIIGVFTAFMIFFSNSLWSESDCFRCEGSKETVWFVFWINLCLAFILLVFVYVGLVLALYTDSAQCVDVVRLYTIGVCNFGFTVFFYLCVTCTFIGGD